MSNLESKNHGFCTNLYYILIFTFIIFSILFFILGMVLNEKFFLEYSPDKSLKDSTINKIHSFQNILFIIGTLSILCALIIILNKTNVIKFIKKFESTIKNLILLCIVIIILLTTLEVTLRIIYHDVTYGPLFGPASIKFNQQYVSLNSENYRDYEFTKEKTQNVTRIIVVGDSFTFGSGIKNVNDTYVKLLESKLNSERNSSYQVFNLGIPGESTKTMYEKANKDTFWKYNADILVIGYNINDIESVSKGQPSHITIIPFFGFWLRNLSYTYLLFEIKVNRILENIGYKKTQTQHFIDRYNSSTDLAKHEEMLINISNQAKYHNVKIVLVIFPLYYSFDNYDFNNAHKYIANIGAENDMVVIDLLDIFSEMESNELVISKYDSHPNEKAHKIAADYIYEKFPMNY